MKITRPALIVNKERVKTNIDRMIAKIAKSCKNTGKNIRFRPHFETHQSAQVGEIFRAKGVTSITVSSVEMAIYFAQNGWKDITIAVLVNPLEIEAIDRLAGTVDLELLIDSPGIAEFLHRKLNHSVQVWIKIDTGYHRTGVEWDRKNLIFEIASAIVQSSNLHFKGLLTHSGHSYRAVSINGIRDVYEDTVSKMNHVRDYLKEKGFQGLEISIGDTPTLSVMETLFGVDEIRCGNFVFYDLDQVKRGACSENDIAVAVACPVIGVYPHRNEIVIYGGGAHLSKEFLEYTVDKQTIRIFGLPTFPGQTLDEWGPAIPFSYVHSLSQEHGIVKSYPEIVEKARVGDILMILPVHSCLTANLLKDYFLFPVKKG
jgi:D-serine deaminase-like pyridoxal phosphate-dependent protein